MNLLAPVLVNEADGRAAQVVLDGQDYPSGPLSAPNNRDRRRRDTRDTPSRAVFFPALGVRRAPR